jgi:hypothetical protein
MVKHVVVRAQQLRELGSGLAMLLASMWNSFVVGSSSGRGGGSGDMFGFLAMILSEAEREGCSNRWAVRSHV